MKKVQFKQWECILVQGNYRNNNRIAFELVDANDGEAVATATVNLPNVEMDDDEVAIKDYSENEGMVDALVEAGVIEKPHRSVQSGYVVIPICKLVK